MISPYLCLLINSFMDVQFAIKVDAGKTLAISYIGYLTQEVTASIAKVSAGRH